MKTIDFLVQELPKIGGWPDGAIGAELLCGEGTLYFWDENGYCQSKWMIDTDTGEIEDTESEITREQYEAALAAKNDGWIEWGGGECQVEEGTLVDVKYRDGVIKKGLRALIANSGRSASRLFWVKDNIPTDIIAYRLHQPKEVAHTEEEQEIDLNECIGQAPVTEWNGEGLPPVGCECEYRKYKKSEQSEWFNGVVKYASEFTVVIQPACYPDETVGHPANFEFRPIRSEVDRKREEAAGKIFDVICKSLTDDSESTSFAIYDAIAAGKITGIKLED